MIGLFLLILAMMSLGMAVGWGIQWRAGNGGWTDVSWTFVMGLVGATAALWPLAAQAPTPRALVLAILIAGWSVRLGLHILARTLNAPEDARYAGFRRDWAPRFQLMMFGFLQLQALAGALLLTAVAIAAHAPRAGLDLRDLAGFALIVIAVLGEGLADRQLRRFAADPAHRGQVCEVGLWAWSRHPNYVFQWLGWVAYPLIAIDLSGAYGWGWAALIAPAYIYYLLRHVSGVPPLEAHMLASRGEAFADYQRRVSVFFPAPQRRRPAPTPQEPQ